MLEGDRDRHDGTRQRPGSRMVMPDRRKKPAGHRGRAVQAGAALFTDGLCRLRGLHPEYATGHRPCREYVNGKIHTNGMENFWSLLKRGLNGTYVSVEPFHLFRYVDEQVFRYDNRATKDNPMNDFDRFKLAASQIVGKRVTYERLDRKNSGGRNDTLLMFTVV